jgi:hypothetical protein
MKEKKDGGDMKLESYETLLVRDLCLAALLRAKGTRMRGIVPQPGGFSAFDFQSNNETDEVLRTFTEGTAICNVRDFWHSLKDLRGLLRGDVPRPKSGQSKPLVS